ncbi:RNA-directed DNA polymerase, eukaryota, reverse transcriptase zinc-binding domain protein [Tanacetum coccineum]
MGVAVEDSLVNSAAFHIGCSTLTAPFSYLGVNVGGNMSRIASWDGAINKVLNRLSKWKMKVLSVGGRLTLLKSVLGAVPLYYMSLFKAPMQGVDLLGAIKKKVGNGFNTRFWEDLWKGEVVLKDLFPGEGSLSFPKLGDVVEFREMESFRSHLVKLDNLPTRLNLSRRGLDLPTILCPSCNLAIESSDHIFFRCPLMKDLYSCIARWWDFCIPEFSSYDQWWEWLINLRLPSKLKVMLESVFYVTWWSAINIHKSKLIGVAVEDSLVNSAAFHIGCSTLTAPFSYLGVNVGGNMSRIASWDDVINKVLNRLSKWKMKVLSVGGRLTLLKSVLGAVPLYYMSLFKAPMQVLEFRVFYALSSLNFKWVWRFRSQGNSIWARVIKALHGEEGNLGCLAKAKFSSNWLDINHSLSSLYNKGVDLLGAIKKKVGNGFNTRFWEDLWKGATLEEVLSNFNWFRCNLSCRVLSFPKLWVWLISGDGEFSVSSVRNLIDEKTLGTVGTKSRWCKLVLIKVNILSWRVKLDNLPTRLNLSRRGLDLPTILCPSCNLAIESSDHIFFRCPLMKDLYSCIARWWDLCIPEFSSYDQWWEWLINLRLPSKLKVMLESVFYVTWWLVWTFRNKTIFGPTPPLRARLFDDVVGFSFTWCNARSKLKFSWLSWLKNPALISM